jgi:hypothetical protein
MSEKPKREEKMWWAVCEDCVRYVKGYSCAPNNPDCWWCPEVGFSATVGHALFETKIQALKKVLKDYKRTYKALGKTIANIQNEISKEPNE